MSRSVTKMQADIAKTQIADLELSNLTVKVEELGYNKYDVVVSNGDAELRYHPLDIDNGASGLDIEVRKQLQAFNDDEAYISPETISFSEFINGGTGSYDVMTHDKSGLHASLGEVVDGGIVEVEDVSIEPIAEPIEPVVVKPKKGANS